MKLLKKQADLREHLAAARCRHCDTGAGILGSTCAVSH